MIVSEMDLSAFRKKDCNKIKDYIKNLICNFFVAFKTKKCVAIPRKKIYYSSKSNFAFGKISCKFFLFALDFLLEKEYVSEKIGYKAFGDNQRCRTSKYWATKKLYSHFQNIDSDAIFTILPPEIILKDRNKKIVDFKLTPELKKLKRTIRGINNLYAGTDIRTIITDERNTTRLFPHLTAIYNNNSWSEGGRLYSTLYRGAYSYQTLSKEERKRITINLNPTVELDYSCLHLTMLYAKCGQTPMATPYGFDTCRELAKKAILVLLNAATEKAAVKALNSEYQHTVDFRPIVAAAKQYHAPIKEFFGSGIGLKLQNEDGKMALAIVDYFCKQGIVCLPVHDSFIIAKKHADKLRDVMQAEFVGRYGITIGIH